jgi:NitT/TauT family transport system substrate-binding protein
MRGLAAAAAVVLACTVAGCGDSGSTGSGGLEKSDIKVGILPIPDAAALHIGIQRGFFKEEGLNIKVEQIQSGALAPPKLKSGALDIALSQYVSSIAALEKGALQWRFLADAYQAGKNVWVLMVAQNSPIRAPKDLAGKTIAVVASRSLPTLMTEATLKTHGVDAKSIRFVEMPVPQMPQAMQKGDVDAIFVSEPFITDTQRRFGARIAVDAGAPGTSTGDFPLAGWGTLDAWVAKNPKTAAAFQRAILRGQKVAAESRAEVSKVLPTYVKGVDAGTAQLVTLGTFPTSLKVSRLQRVADLMQLNGYLERKVDVGPMIVPPPAQ